MEPRLFYIYPPRFVNTNFPFSISIPHKKSSYPGGGGSIFIRTWVRSLLSFLLRGSWLLFAILFARS